MTEAFLVMEACGRRQVLTADVLENFLEFDEERGVAVYVFMEYGTWILISFKNLRPLRTCPSC